MTATERVRVGDLLQIQRRSVGVDPGYEYYEIGVRSFGKGIFHKDPVLGASLGQKRVFYIEPGDLVISNVFAWEGAIAYATESELGRIGSHRFMTFTAIDPGIIDTEWASWYFRSEPGLELIRQASPGSAGRNRTLAIERFEALEIPLPPPDEQRRIALRLERIRGIADRAMNSVVNCSPKEILQLAPALYEHVLASSCADLMPVRDLVDFVSDTVHPGDDPIPAARFVGLEHIEGHTGVQRGSDPLGMMKGRKLRFRPGDLVYGYLRPYQNKVWVADINGLCSVDQYVLRAKPGVNPSLVAFGLRSRSVLNRINDLTHSLQLPRLRSGLLANLAIPTVAVAAENITSNRLMAVRDGIVSMADQRARQIAISRALIPSALNESFAHLH